MMTPLIIVLPADWEPNEHRRWPVAEHRRAAYAVALMRQGLAEPEHADLLSVHPMMYPTRCRICTARCRPIWRAGHSRQIAWGYPKSPQPMPNTLYPKPPHPAYYQSNTLDCLVCAKG